MSWTVSAVVVAVSFCFGVVGVRLLLTQDKVEQEQYDLLEVTSKNQHLRTEVDDLQLQVREVQMLYEARWESVISYDGRLEMLTSRDAGRLCAHWCARMDPGGPCLPSGPDRCIPDE